ncbi:hypothetical protein [Burkholderia vietnamiensis]|uniref:hypothetical protein n=1 Tax=Burkholderia vietnamiensis TaxID=60552 RepID=UPI00264E13B0|nr:hypothetical protein [Burkholderia vietnamiensis]MDN7819063.1 hypothetical protein [Burkholderia vietnamiensis]
MNTSFIPQISPAQSLLEQLHAPTSVRKVSLSQALIDFDEASALIDMSAGKRVLNVGCVGAAPIDPASHLHLKLSRANRCAELIGVDADRDGLNALSQYCEQPLYADLAQVSGPVDVVLASGVLERTGNLSEWFEQVDQLDFRNIVVTVRDAAQCQSSHFDFADLEEVFVEVVPAENVCWFTPYTLTNAIRTLTRWHVKGLFRLGKH